MGELLHYHVVLDDDPDACWTFVQPAMARRILREQRKQGRPAHVFECVPSDPACPSRTNRTAPSGDGERSRHDEPDP